jgi:mRNA interferase MazF
MAHFSRGVLFWARLDKRRPVLVVSHEARNQHANDLVVVPCSTHLRPMVWHVLLDKAEGGLLAPSVAKCEQVTTVRKTELEPTPLGAALSAQRMREIERAIVSALGILTTV